MILLDGKKLSEKILDELREEVKLLKKEMRLAIVTVGEDAVMAKFVAQKKRIAAALGITVKEYPFEPSITTNQLRARLAAIVHEKKNDGVIIQLPLPAHVNTQYILNAVPPEKDTDVLSARAVGNFVVGKSEILPPVVGAVKAFLEEYRIDYKNASVAVVGAGNLVGRPVALWLLNEKVTLSVVRSSTKNPVEILSRADIIISGIGRPNHITADMVKAGAAVIDAGTSESEGGLVGDVDFESVSEKASFITPVPGGVGPVTTAMLFKNLLTLAKNKK